MKRAVLFLVVLLLGVFTSVWAQDLAQQRQELLSYCPICVQQKIMLKTKSKYSF
ncbi:MAG: hypothetical protein R2779_07710 [Crocinitomicaceae bacterium]